MYCFALVTLLLKSPNEKDLSYFLEHQNLQNPHTFLTMFGVFSSLFSLAAQIDSTTRPCSALLSLQLKETDDRIMLFFPVSPAQISDQEGFELLSRPLESPKTREKVSNVWRLLFCSLCRLKDVSKRAMVCSFASAAQIFEQKRIWARKHV